MESYIERRKMNKAQKFLASVQENVRIEEIAEIAGLSPMRIRQFENAGLIKSFKDGRTRLYDKWPTILAITKHYMEKAEQNYNPETEKMADAKLRRMTVKAKLAELKLAQLEGELHRPEDIERLMGAVLTRLRKNLLAIPMSLAPVIQGMDTMEIAEKMDERIRRAMTDAAELDLEKLVEEEYSGQESHAEAKQRRRVSGAHGRRH
jgi:phage terminase Nu1 subunit (DNA packaging protein)